VRGACSRCRIQVAIANTRGARLPVGGRDEESANPDARESATFGSPLGPKSSGRPIERIRRREWLDRHGLHRIRRRRVAKTDVHAAGVALKIKDEPAPTPSIAARPHQFYGREVGAAELDLACWRW